jgi:type I restriction enzyme S subunit
MNAERLLAQYEQIAEAPDAIPQLRRFVLDLAVRGKLVQQDRMDEPALELLRRIAKEKARLVRAGEIRRPKEVTASYELPFSLPPDWASAALDQLSPRSLVDGDWIETKDQSVVGTVRLIQLADIGVGNFLDKSERFITEATEVQLKCTRLVPGDVLIARLPNPIGRACLFPDIGQPAITVVDVAILRSDQNVVPAFLVLALNSPPTRSQIEAYGKGTTRFRVSTGHLKTVVLPVPPIGEQRRIVAKVDELMALCDRLERARATRELVRDRIVAVSLGRLSAPHRTSSISEDACFVCDQLATMTAKSDHIQRFRGAIRNLAVRGKLLPQIPTEERATVSRIRDESEGDGRLDVRLPENWGWARVEDVAESRLGKMLDKARNKGTPRPYLRNTNVHWFDVRLDDLKTIPMSDEEFEEFQLKRGDVLICEGGHGIGRTAVWRDSDRDFVFQKALHRVRAGDYLDPDFFALCCCVYFDAGVMQTYFTGVGIPHFTGKALAKLSFPLPPLAEQRRIVAKVDEIMALCDRLEARLETAAESRNRLLELLMAEALNGPPIAEAA